MARGDAVIDIDIDPFAERASRWRTLLRIGVPVLGVVLTIAVILERSRSMPIRPIAVGRWHCPRTC